MKKAFASIMGALVALLLSAAPTLADPWDWQINETEVAECELWYQGYRGTKSGILSGFPVYQNGETVLVEWETEGVTQVFLSYHNEPFPADGQEFFVVAPTYIHLYGYTNGEMVIECEINAAIHQAGTAKSIAGSGNGPSVPECPVDVDVCPPPPPPPSCEETNSCPPPECDSDECQPPPPPPEECPPGQVGTPPNCQTPGGPPEECPPGQVGTPPNCNTPGGPPEECPPGQVGNPPNCNTPGGPPDDNCNNGVGNGGEGCTPGNAPENDECEDAAPGAPCNSGRPENPGRP